MASAEEVPWIMDDEGIGSQFQTGSRAAENLERLEQPISCDQSVMVASLQVAKLESHLASKNPLEILVLRHEFTAKVGSSGLFWQFLYS